MKNDMTDINQIAITSPDGRQERLGRLRALFPDLFDGEGQLNEKALRALVSSEAGVVAERLTFEWAGKQKSRRFAFAPSKATLQFDAKRSLNKDGSPNKAGETLEDNTSENLIIEGDNLEVLKLLQTSYFEQVKCIYIDPPYNTGNDFIYPDDYSQTRKDYWEKNGTVKDGVKLVALAETNGRRHSSWLNMMQARLLQSRSLLRDDGVIFVSIDDNEVHNLRKLMDEVFGEENYRNTIAIRRGAKSVQAQFETWDKLGIAFEYVLFYSKSSNFRFPKMTRKLEEAKVGSWNNHWRGTDRPSMRYNIFGNTPIHGQWRWSQERSITAIANYNRLVSEIGKSPDAVTKDDVDKWYIKQGQNIDLLRLSSAGKPEHYVPATDTTLLNDVWFHIPTNGSRLITNILGKRFFDNPKPIDLIKQALKFCHNDSVILDFFAGSGTSAHAIMQKNIEDGGNRKHIMVQIPELTDEKSEAYKAGYKKISDITIERVKRAGAKICKENPDTFIDTGFRVFKLSDSNFPENLFSPDPAKPEEENLKALETHLAKAAQLRLFDKDEFSNLVTEISLKNGFGLFYELRPVSELSKNKVYRLVGNDKSALLCLDNNLYDETVEGLKLFRDEQLIVSKSALDTTKKFSLQTEFKDNLWVV